MKRLVLLVAVAGVLLGGCASLKQFGLAIERPTAKIGDVSISRLTFSEAELTTELVVDNPNAVGVTFSGFSYSMQVEGVELVSGDQRTGASIAAFGTSSIDFPVQVGYENILDTIAAVGDATEVGYAIDVTLRVDVPILGEVAIPLHYDGKLPVVRVPTLRLSDLALDSISISGATLSATFTVLNPNSFAFTLNELDYSLEVQNRVWTDGGTTRSSTVPALGASDVSVRFSLSFAEFGRTLRDLLLGDDAIAYHLSAQADIDPDLALMPTVSLPFDRSGSIPLRRR